VAAEVMAVLLWDEQPKATAMRPEPAPIRNLPDSLPFALRLHDLSGRAILRPRGGLTYNEHPVHDRDDADRR
jgi:hypothetical protein